ncbi:MAG: hypothetical protein KJ893_06920 [Candidatus Omnitrophica bacterium]|nr:hypothetical protein [Candidatus Omnitrophota bacterium]MBU4478567.1 hypothetical protein [Candidatus Omnitrophota bacterium]MCG2703565.1 hypothetical protein [Candidatus Omnitrophota bacterium]
MNYSKFKKGMAGLLVFSMCLMCVPVFAFADSSDDEWGGTDKALHFTVSCGISILSYKYYRKNTEWSKGGSRAAAFATTLAVGAVKEFIDDEFNWKDMGADALGALVGIGFTVRF